MAHKGGHLAQVVGHQIAGSRAEGLAVGRREKPRDVPEAGEVAVHVAPLAKREHLVDPYTGETLRMGLDRIHNRHRLAVAHADDEVDSLADMIEDTLGRTALLLKHRTYGQWMGHIYTIDQRCSGR